MQLGDLRIMLALHTRGSAGVWNQSSQGGLTKCVGYERERLRKCAPYGWETVIQLARALAGHAFELRYTKLEHVYLTALDYLNTITTTRTFNNYL